MKQYIRAELELYKKNRINVIMGLCGLFLYALLLLFSGIGGSSYCAAISIIGFVDVLLFLIPLYLSPASYWRNRQKVCISSEQFILILGESKRTYVKVRIAGFAAIYLMVTGITAFMQIPAYLIAGEQYSVYGFGIEIVLVTAFAFLSLPVLCLVQARFLSVAIPLWSGFCGGFAGGFLGTADAVESSKEEFRTYLIFMIVTVSIGILSMGYRYWKTIREERGGKSLKRGV